ncbi:ABC transporter permease [Edaphobacter bradus]|uniref:ABC transporter permease n=1 Tax=Edaphobacter bradus TaxID=2259016 RepID=UPI0021DFBFCE|nr:ABC transporter permease [Edaphobacter bradus]
MALTLSRPTSFERTLASARSTMMFSEIVLLAIDSFRASKVRFLLTMLGMIIGSASIILVVTLGLTGKQYAHNLISSIGPNMIEMQYNGGSVVGPDNTTTPDFMTRDDMQAVVDQVPGIIASSPMLEDHDRVSIGGGVVKETMILGVSPQYKEVRNLVVLGGRFFDDQDARSHTKVAVIVASFANELYGSPKAAVGRSVSIHGIPFVIIGVFKESVETFGTSEISDQTILIPYEVARYFTGTNTVKQIFFTMKDSSLVLPASHEVLDIIKSRHRATSVYTAFNLTQVLGVMDKIANMLTIVLTLAAAITLIVSGVGIMNSMLANVAARIREIGIRKAIGATSREIRLQFLTEAVFLSLCGGFVGTVLGLAIPLSISFLTPFKIPVSPWSAVIALGTSVLVGVLFGTLPANRAARLDPVQTLKYE